MVAALLCGGFPVNAQTQSAVPASSGASEAPAPRPHWIRGTPVRLMVVKEVNSRQAKAGDRFKLRVDAPVLVDSQVAIPVGAIAWGEIIVAQGTGAAGGRGHLSARLLYVDAPSGRVVLAGTQGQEGKSNSSGVVLGVLSFGLLGLLTKGGNATFKAGDMITGYIDEGDTPAGAPLRVGPG